MTDGLRLALVNAETALMDFDAESARERDLADEITDNIKALLTELEER